jgi:hypothetical protein
MSIGFPRLGFWILSIAGIGLLTAPAMTIAKAQSAGPQLRSLHPPVLSPDGTGFQTWECPLHFSRT